MFINEHGGDCCGINHIYGFPLPFTKKTVLALEKQIEMFKDDYKNYDDNEDHEGCVLLEAVLNERQYRNKGDGESSPNFQGKTWHQVLLEHGFKLVTVFRNINSENLCYVYHLYEEPEE